MVARATMLAVCLSNGETLAKQQAGQYYGHKEAAHRRDILSRLHDASLRVC